MCINEIWTNLDSYTDIDAAFLWLDMEPQLGDLPRCVQEVHFELLNKVNKTCITGGVETVLKPDPLINEFRKAGFEELQSSEATSTEERGVISNEKNNLQPYWVYKRCDLIAYANAINFKPLFLFPDPSNEVDSDQKDIEKLAIKHFIEKLIDKFPRATSKGISAHCFEYYKGNTRKLGAPFIFQWTVLKNILLASVRDFRKNDAP